MELNAISVVVLLRKIKNIKYCNDSMIEQYNAIQSEIGGSLLVRIDGKKEEVIKKIKQWCDKYNFEPITLKFKGRIHELNRQEKTKKSH